MKTFTIRENATYQQNKKHQHNKKQIEKQKNIVDIIDRYWKLWRVLTFLTLQKKKKCFFEMNNEMKVYCLSM